MFRAQTNRSLAEIVEDKLLHSYEIRPFPRVVVKLIEAIRNPNIPIDAVGLILLGDAAMCAKVLKMANSPIIGAGQKVSRIDHAITILGFNRIKALAQSHAAAAVITGDGTHMKIRQSLWKHSLACAIAARVFAQRLNVADQADAFLAGIFHDVGHLFFLDTVPDQYLEILEQSSPIQTAERELARFGISHQEAGMRLALAWELPETVRLAIGYHHRPKHAIAHEEFAWIIYLADHLVHAYGIGSERDPTIMQADLTRGPFYLTPELMNAIRMQVVEEYDEFQQAYG